LGASTKDTIFYVKKSLGTRVSSTYR